MLLGFAFAAAPAAMAQDRGVVVQVLGGGYSHTTNLTAAGPEAHFKTGFNVGGALGFQFNKYVAVHGDFTFARNQGTGAVPFNGKDVNRYFYGGHIELRYPIGNDFAPFVFGGGGAVTIDQQGAEASEAFKHFTKAAGMFGAGASYRIPGTPLEVLGEGKVLTYKWISAGFNRTQWDLSYSLGFAYRFGL
jgi:hypothetical protein